MAEEQIAEYHNDLRIIEQDYTRTAQQREEKLKEIRELDLKLGHLQGAAAYVRGKLNLQQAEEPEIVEEVTIEENEDNTEGE